MMTNYASKTYSGGALLLLLMLLGGCDSKPAADDYFPLNKGLIWEYQVETDLTERSFSRRLQIENLGDYTLGKETLQVRRSSDGTDYYIRRSATGVERVAKRTIVELEPQLDTPAQPILPIPAALGKTWSNITQSYTLHRIMPNFEAPERSTMHFNMSYELAALDETVTVPAGIFEHCLRVDGLAQVSLYADARQGFHNIDISSREWYAPGVGLVKLERIEPLAAEVVHGGKVTLELVGFY